MYTSQNSYIEKQVKLGLPLGSSEEEDVGLRGVEHKMHPAWGLLNTKIPPLCLCH